jgi:hypothetical protein
MLDVQKYIFLHRKLLETRMKAFLIQKNGEVFDLLCLVCKCPFISDIKASESTDGLRHWHLSTRLLHYQ